MAHNTSRLKLEFDGEVLIPRVNIEAYWKIYTAEAWFRRMCLTAWMTTYGSTWTSEVDERLKRKLEDRARASRDRLYLAAETHDDLVWQAMHGELIQLVSDEKVKQSVRDLTGAPSKFLADKFNEVREIRNLLAHNRALSERTYVILQGLLASLEEAVDTFRGNVLYTYSGEIVSDVVTEGSQSFQGFTMQHDKITEYVCLPAKPFNRWPDARLLHEEFRLHLNDIIAFCLNKTGDEYTILTPRTLDDETHKLIAEKFFKRLNVWTRQPFEEQEPRFVCSPKIWFYENQSPFPGRR